MGSSTRTPNALGHACRVGTRQKEPIPQLLRSIITLLLFASPSAGFHLDSKRLLRPFCTVGHWEEVGSPFGLLRAHLAAQTRINACPRLHAAHSCADQEPADALGWWNLTVQTHGRMHARAHTHTHTPNYLRDGESLRIGRQSRHSYSGGRETSQGCFLLPHHPPPPIQLMVKEHLKVSRLRGELSFFNRGGGGGGGGDGPNNIHLSIFCTPTVDEKEN